MPQLDLLNPVPIYADPAGSAKIKGEELDKKFYTWPPTDTINEKEGMVPRNNSKNLLKLDLLDPGKNAINLEWRNITLRKNDVQILNGLWGTARSGELTAIMGPSGSGKTSLVNILSGFSQEGVTGDVLVNGAKRDLVAFRKLSCYILQDDHILPRFTVRELITFASRLKIPAIFSEKDRQRAVDDCIYCLGLVAQQHQKANTLSGGQRKRLCIAQDIVNNPPVIFLDEPTSGLDSSSCLQCIQLLKTLALGGRNIICTIHQPSSRIFEIFDTLYMISNGDCIYRGPAPELLPYLESHGLQCPKYHSPTDFLTDVAIGLYGEWNWRLKKAVKAADDQNENWYKIDMGEAYKRKNFISSAWSSFKNKIKDATRECWQDIITNIYSTSTCNQFRVLLKRSFFDLLRDPINLQMKFLGSIVIGLLLGSMYYNTGNDGTKVFHTAGLLFTLLIYLVITSKVPTILTFPLQKSIFEREHLNGWYSTKAYYFATTTAQVPFLIICPAISCGLLYWLSGQPNEMYRFGMFLLTGIIVSFNAEAIGLMIGASTSIQTGVLLGTMIASISTLFSGFFIAMKDTPKYLKWLYEVSFTRFAFTNFLLSIFYNRPPLDCNRKFCYYRDPMKFVKNLDLEGDPYSLFCIMIAIFILLRISSYLLLEYKASQLK